MNKMDFTEESVTNLDEMWSLYHKFQKPNDPWIFRGQPNSKDQPRPSLERLAEKFSISFGTLPELESALLRHFKRQAHLYVANLPKDEDTIEWLALMRHYGAPTRLLDWTFSFFVALFFGVETAKEEFAVWALDYPWLRDQAMQVFQTEVEDLRSTDPRWKSGEFFTRVFCRTPPFDLVYSLNPERLNQRLVIQQGIFLAPANLSKSFAENFVALQKTDAKPHERLIKITFSNSVSVRKDILRSLFRMNINSATLFPGLESFAESLNSLLAMPDILKGRLPYT
jgi:hypothetical protein